MPRYPLGIPKPGQVDETDHLIFETQALVRRQFDPHEPPPDRAADPLLVPKALWLQIQRDEFQRLVDKTVVQQDSLDLVHNFRVEAERERAANRVRVATMDRLGIVRRPPLRPSPAPVLRSIFETPPSELSVQQAITVATLNENLGPLREEATRRAQEGDESMLVLGHRPPVLGPLDLTPEEVETAIREAEAIGTVPARLRAAELRRSLESGRVVSARWQWTGTRRAPLHRASC